MTGGEDASIRELSRLIGGLQESVRALVRAEERLSRTIEEKDRRAQAFREDLRERVSRLEAAVDRHRGLEDEVHRNTALTTGEAARGAERERATDNARDTWTARIATAAFGLGIVNLLADVIRILSGTTP